MQDFILILLPGLLVGWLAKRMGQPTAVAQVLLGVIIGPPLLGWVNSSEFLEIIGQLGIVLLLGMAGLHIGSKHLLQQGWTALWVAVFGIFLCLTGGYAFATLWGSPHAEAVYVGTALTATSIGISVQVLLQLGLIDQQVGKIVIAAAVIDDVLALYLLATAHGLLSEEMMLYQVVISMFKVALVLIVIYMVCRWIADRSKIIFTQNNIDYLGLLLSTSIIILFGWITEELGYSMVVGGFFAGLGLGDGMQPASRKLMAGRLGLIVPLFVPFFFVLIGSKAQWRVLADAGMVSLVIGLLFIAIAGKVLGGYLGALRAAGKGNSLLIGLSMTPRGEVAFVIAGLGYFQQHISHHMLVALILVAIGTALLSPLAMAKIVHRMKKNDANSHPEFK